jgi:hypothetical protein
MNLGVKMGLGVIGMPQKTIDDIERVMPNAERLMALRPEVEALYAKAKPDIDVVAPVLLEVMAFLQK